MKYLKVWTNFRDVICHLKDDEKGRLFDAMLLYADTGEEPEIFEGNELVIWPVAKRDIDMAAEWRETCRTNGLKGGRPKTQLNPEEPKKTQLNPEEPNHNLKEKKRNEKKGNEKKVFITPTVDEVRDYCRERGNSVNPERFIDFYSSKGWKVGNQPMKDWRACVRTWEQRDRDPERPAKVVVAQQYQQRDYESVPGDIESQTDELMAEYLRQKGAS